MEEFITACPRNCYSTCTFRVFTENNRLKRILPYTGNLATPEGPCIKGLSYLERAHSPDRILHPLRKDAGGRFRRISVNDALGAIAENLRSVRMKYGPHAVLWYRGSGNAGLTNEIGHSFWKYYGGATITYGNLCWPAGLEAVRLTLGSVKHNVPWDLVNAKTIVIWGKNPAETNVQEMAFIGKARAAGARVICIDPRQTPTADKSDIWFSPRPGTDAALALAVAWVLVQEKLVNIDFINKHVQGFAEFTAKSLIDPAEAADLCGIPSHEIVRLARIIAGGGPVTFLPGYGLQRYTNGGQTTRAILSLAVITGNLGKPGSGFNYANLQSYIYDSPKEPLSYYPDPQKDKPFRRSISMARFGEDFFLTKDPEIKTIWVERGNPLLQLPASGLVDKAFSHSEFTVVAEQFMTDTARKADIILPAKDIFEQSDIIGSYWSPYVQFKPKVLEPEGEVLPENEIYHRLSEILGLNIPPELIPPPGNDNIEAWLTERIKNPPGITLDRLREGPLIPPGLQEIAWNDLRFETPSGKIELCPEGIAEKWNVPAHPSFVSLAGAEGISPEYPLVFISPNKGSRIHSQFGNLEVIRLTAGQPGAEIAPDDADQRDIRNGDNVIIFNDSGSVRTTALVTGRVRPGTIVLHNGIWRDEGGGSNNVTMPLETDMGFGAAFHGVRVEVRKEK